MILQVSEADMSDNIRLLSRISGDYLKFAVCNLLTARSKILHTKHLTFWLLSKFDFEAETSFRAVGGTSVWRKTQTNRKKIKAVS